MLEITMLGEYFYPLLKFKIEPVSNVLVKNYKVIFLENNKNPIDIYESPVNDLDLNETIIVTCKTAIDSDDSIKARLFLNDELIKEYEKK